MTPPSVRFLGRKVSLGAVVILMSAMRQGPTPRRVHELARLLGSQFLIECQGTERSFNAPPDLQDSVGEYMNCQVTARLVLRRNCVGVVGPKRATGICRSDG
jgi:hypothetical protein